eukprot:TRINITY_DN6208_c0_g1_i1.p1 TRINITY_DN6208_c0_g1~~TRINITY_DN6208_c0_g1_i1.p1  ORF type:complete len:175 (-),score=41.16 TRINITY_DN6208_c0_g1_i1:18-542(-)
MSVLIRPYREEDVPAIMDLLRGHIKFNADNYMSTPAVLKVQNEHLPSVMLDLQNIQVNYGGKGCFLVAEDQSEGREGILVGCVGLIDKGDGVGEVKRFTVDPTVHRRGIGSKLMKGIEDYMKKEGYTRLFLTTLSIFDAACGFYDRTFTLEKETKFEGDLVDFGYERLYAKEIK